MGCLIFTLIFTIYFSMELDGVITSLILSSFLGVLYGTIHSRKTIKFFIDIQALKKMIFFSLPLVLSSLLLWINTYADRILIRTFLGIEDVGIYAVGFRISNITSLVALGFQGALMPLIYANYRNLESKESLKYIFVLFLSVALFFIFFLTVFSKEFVQIISTDEYIAASKVIFYLSLSILFTQIYIFYARYFSRKENEYHSYDQLFKLHNKYNLEYHINTIIWYFGSIYCHNVGKFSCFLFLCLL